MFSCVMRIFKEKTSGKATSKKGSSSGSGKCLGSGMVATGSPQASIWISKSFTSVGLKENLGRKSTSLYSKRMRAS